MRILANAVLLLVPAWLSGGGNFTPMLRAAASQDLPRTADGKPDMSGVWQATGTPAGIDVGRPGGIVGGGLVPYQPWAEAKYKEYNSALGKDDPATRCLPPGPPRINYIFPIQFVQKPGLIVGLYEYMHVFRVIHTDGRPHPRDPNPTFKGDATGHWEGDTLVVDVVGFKPGWYDQAGNFYTDALHVVERYTLTDADTIAYEVTLEDVKAYTRPWKMSFKFNKKPADFELLEYECSENEKDIQHLVGK
jgi:hypothetical protein